MRRDTINYENCSALSKNEPPVADGIKKPMKKGGYSDSGADIVYCLKENGEDVILPCENPNIYNRQLKRVPTHFGSIPFFMILTR